mmetsp:Transcript_54552/g.127521  ORF Transcript_54552/g.127521 Transcript_54552/m.127521 type:complete len:718 (+) Transcript_54552:84-2237(+)
MNDAQEGGAASSSAVPLSEECLEVPVHLLPPDSEDKYKGLIKLPTHKLVSMLKALKDVPLSGSKESLVVRLLRQLADLPPTEADERLFAVVADSRKVRKPRRWKLKVVSDKKVGILKQPALDAEVKEYAQAGAVFDAKGFEKVGEDEKLFWQLADGRGWVAQCSRKDTQKMVVAMMSGPPLAEGAAAAAAANPLGMSKKEVQAILAAEAAAKKRSRRCAKCGKTDAAQWRSDKDTGEDLCSTCYVEVTMANANHRAEEAAAHARLLALLEEEEKRQKEELRAHEEEQKLAQEEDEEAKRIQTRLIFEAERMEATRKIAEVIEATAQQPAMEVTVPKRRRLVKKQQPTQVELDFEAAAERLEEEGYGEGDEDDLMLGRSAGRQRDIKDAPEPPCDLPAGQEERYHALWTMQPQKLRQMLKEEWMPTNGDKATMAARLILHINGCAPMEADKAQVKQLQHRWRVLQRHLRDHGKVKGAGKGKAGIQRDFTAVGPSKDELRTFVGNFLDEADLSTVNIGELNLASEKEFGKQAEKVRQRVLRYVARSLRQRMAMEEEQKNKEQSNTEEVAQGEAAEPAPAPAAAATSATSRHDEDSDDSLDKESGDSEAGKDDMGGDLAAALAAAGSSSDDDTSDEEPLGTANAAAASPVAAPKAAGSPVAAAKAAASPVAAPKAAASPVAAPKSAASPVAEPRGAKRASPSSDDEPLDRLVHAADTRKE